MYTTPPLKIGDTVFAFEPIGYAPGCGHQANVVRGRVIAWDETNATIEVPGWFGHKHHVFARADLADDEATLLELIAQRLRKDKYWAYRKGVGITVA